MLPMLERTSSRNNDMRLSKSTNSSHQNCSKHGRRRKLSSSAGRHRPVPLLEVDFQFRDAYTSQRGLTAAELEIRDDSAASEFNNLNTTSADSLSVSQFIGGPTTTHEYERFRFHSRDCSWSESPPSTAISASALMPSSRSVPSTASPSFLPNMTSLSQSHEPSISVMQQTQTNKNAPQLESTLEEHARIWNIWLRSRAERTIFAYLLRCATEGEMPQKLSTFQQSCYEILRREIQIKTARWCPRMETSVRTAITETLFTSPYLRFASGYVSATRYLEATCGASSPGSQSTSMDAPATFNVIPVACGAHDHCRVCRESSPEAAIPQRTPSPPTSCVLALRLRHEAEASSLPQIPFSLTLGPLEEIPFGFDDGSTSMTPFLYGNESS